MVRYAIPLNNGLILKYRNFNEHDVISSEEKCKKSGEATLFLDTYVPMPYRNFFMPKNEFFHAHVLHWLHHVMCRFIQTVKFDCVLTLILHFATHITPSNQQKVYIKTG